MRHTTATVLLEVGIHPKVVQDLLGHSTIAVTLDTSSDVAPALHSQAIGALGRQFMARSQPQPSDASSQVPDPSRGPSAPLRASDGGG